MAEVDHVIAKDEDSKSGSRILSKGEAENIFREASSLVHHLLLSAVINIEVGVLVVTVCSLCPTSILIFPLSIASPHLLFVCCDSCCKISYEQQRCPVPGWSGDVAVLVAMGCSTLSFSSHASRNFFSFLLALHLCLSSSVAALSSVFTFGLRMGEKYSCRSHWQCCHELRLVLLIRFLSFIGSCIQFCLSPAQPSKSSPSHCSVPWRSKTENQKWDKRNREEAMGNDRWLLGHDPWTSLEAIGMRFILGIWY
ncbi:uncharacterized protein LOC129316554 [Prosopis cineraria]|uniref:uncharacterized protein LOC129316554 n=1 Tax=Prosopis cineraria TaxID=364024 RepID=UPI0024102390|nr:uncharacterized protein LOC129316554 [Prosopis cineraria]